MDAETKLKFDNVELKLEHLSSDLTKSIRMGFKGVRQYQDANATIVHGQLKTIVDQGVVRNHRLDVVEDDMGEQQKDTGLWRWMHRNPAKAIGITVIFFALVAFGLHKIDVNQTIENTTGVSIRSNETTTVTNEID